MSKSASYITEVQQIIMTSDIWEYFPFFKSKVEKGFLFDSGNLSTPVESSFELYPFLFMWEIDGERKSVCV